MISLEFSRSYLLPRGFLTLTGHNPVAFHPALILDSVNAFVRAQW